MSVKPRESSASPPDIHEEDVSSLNCKVAEYFPAGKFMLHLTKRKLIESKKQNQKIQNGCD